MQFVPIPMFHMLGHIEELYKLFERGLLQLPVCKHLSRWALYLVVLNLKHHLHAVPKWLPNLRILDCVSQLWAWALPLIEQMLGKLPGHLLLKRVQQLLRVMPCPLQRMPLSYLVLVLLDRILRWEYLYSELQHVIVRECSFRVYLVH